MGAASAGPKVKISYALSFDLRDRGEYWIELLRDDSVSERLQLFHPVGHARSDARY